MRALAIIIGLLTLTACDSNRRVAFTGAAEPARPTATATNTTDEYDLDAEAARAEAKLEAEKVQRLRLALLEYRGNVEYVLTIIWSKTDRTAAESAALVPAVDRILKANAKLMKQSRLTETDARMLTEGADVLRTVRGTLINK